jgi:hypothetical protein
MRGSSVSEAKVVSLPQDHNPSLWLLEIAAPVKAAEDLVGQECAACKQNIVSTWQNLNR